MGQPVDCFPPSITLLEASVPAVAFHHHPGNIPNRIPDDIPIRHPVAEASLHHLLAVEPWAVPELRSGARRVADNREHPGSLESLEDQRSDVPASLEARPAAVE